MGRLKLIGIGALLMICIGGVLWGMVTENPKSDWQTHRVIRANPDMATIKVGDIITDHKYIIEMPYPKWMYDPSEPTPVPPATKTPDAAQTLSAKTTATAVGPIQTATASAILKGPPLEAQIATIECTMGLACDLQATVTGGTPPYTFAWNFGDNTGGSNNPQATHIFGVSQSFTVTLTVQDIKANKASAARSITINAPSQPIKIGIDFQPVIHPQYTSITAFFSDLFGTLGMALGGVLLFYIVIGMKGHLSIRNMSDSFTQLANGIHKADPLAWGRFWAFFIVMFIIITLVRYLLGA